jgi:hypothetical protein
LKKEAEKGLYQVKMPTLLTNDMKSALITSHKTFVFFFSSLLGLRSLRGRRPFSSVDT